MKTKNKHIQYIVGLVIALISMIPPMPNILKYLIALVPVLFFGADLTLQYMEGFFKKNYLNKNLAGIIAGLGMIVTGKLGYAALTMLFFSASDYYFDMIFTKASRRIEESSRVTTSFARTGVNGSVSRIPVASVVPGQQLVVQTGDIIPCDCVATSGEAVVDYTNLFGKGDARNAKVGTSCFGGGIVQKGNLTVKVLKPARESMGSVISSATKKAAKPSRFQRKLNGWATLFERSVYLLSIILFIIILIVTKEFATAVSQSVSVLVLSATAGLTKVIPLLNRNALLSGRRRGVLFTDIQALEQSGKVQTVSMNETVSEEVMVQIEEVGAIPAQNGNTALDAVVYRDRARLESDPNPSFKFAVGFFSSKAQATTFEPKSEHIVGAIRTGRNHRNALLLNIICLAVQKLVTLTLIFWLAINPATVLVIEFVAWLFCLINSTKEI